MKKYALIIISLILAFSLVSCSDIYKETIVTDTEEYRNIWSLPERRVNESSLLFPSEINEECAEFKCIHTAYKWVGTGWQITLKLKYNDNLNFEAEIDRLNTLSENSPIHGNSDYFDKTAYASAWNWNGCFEYAVVDEAEKTVNYIYLQLADKDQLIIDDDYIPGGYEMELTDSETYSVYE